MSFSSPPQVGLQQTVGPTTLYDKIWANHIIQTYGDSDDTALVYIDRHLVHDASSPAAFDGLRKAGLPVRRPDCTLATADHGVPTTSRKAFKSLREYYGDDVRAHVLGEVLEQNTHEFGVLSFGVTDKRQGIVHIVGPEQGFTLPGTICVCGDSHTATHGAFGCVAFGIGTSQVEQVLATQTLLQPKSKNMRITVDGTLSDGVTSKDVILHIIGVIGTAGGTGCVIEYAGSAIRSLSMEARMSMCNMSIEAGARAGMIAPDTVTFDYLRNRPLAPKGAAWERAVAYWKTLTSDDGARFDREVVIRAEDIAPTVTWGTSPQDVVPITGRVPDPKSIADAVRRVEVERSLAYMGLEPNTFMEDIPVDRVFIGSCTNSRIEDLRAAAKIVLAAGPGAKIAAGVVATVVPGSGLVKQHAEAEGLDVVFTRAGFEWREAGCSMCIALNGDKAAPRERCASTNNRNFEGRQGPGARTHLLGPAMAAAAAMTGKLTDVRKFGQAAAVEGGPKLSLGNEKESLVDPLTLVPSPISQETTAPIITQPRNTFKSRVPQFTVVKGIAVPLHIENVNTDLITTAEVCKTMKRGELGRGLLLPLRHNSTTGESLGFILDRPPYTEAKVLVCTGRNFGCGSSREKAVWAIQDFGIRCVIAPSFADIFRNNCFQCGVLPIELPVATCRELAQDAESQNELEIDLERLEIRRADIALPAVSFTVDTFRRACLLKGFDDIAMALAQVDAIEEYERIRRETWPWLDGTGYVLGKSGPVSLSTVSDIEGW